MISTIFEISENCKPLLCTRDKEIVRKFKSFSDIRFITVTAVGFCRFNKDGITPLYNVYRSKDKSGIKI